MGGAQGCRPRTEGLAIPDPHLWPHFCGPHSLASRLLPMPRDFHFALRRRETGAPWVCGGGDPWGSSLQSLSSLLSSQQGYGPTEARKSDQQLHHPEVGGPCRPAPVLCILGPLGQQRDISRGSKVPKDTRTTRRAGPMGLAITVERWCRDLVQLQRVGWEQLCARLQTEPQCVR